MPDKWPEAHYELARAAEGMEALRAAVAMRLGRDPELREE